MSPAHQATGLELEQLHARRGGVDVLRGIDLIVARNEFLVVLGPSGTGKSTLLRVVAGLDPATTGRIVIAGQDVTRLRPGRRSVSMVFQSYNLFPHLTVAQNIAFPLLANKVLPANATQRAGLAAQACGCAHLLDRRPGQLSGGEQQRVALARALVREPAVYLLDEPLSNLDLELRMETRGELKALHARVGGTVVHVTHDQSEALALGHRIAVLHQGRIEQVGTPDEIWRAPATAFVARFVGSPGMNLVPTDGPWQPPATGGVPARQLGFRPETVRLGGLHRVGADPSGHNPNETDGSGEIFAGFAAEGTIDRVDVIGDDALVYVQVGSHTIASRVGAAGRRPLGARVRVAVRWSDVHFFDAAGLRLK